MKCNNINVLFHIHTKINLSVKMLVKKQKNGFGHFLH